MLLGVKVCEEIPHKSALWTEMKKCEPSKDKAYIFCLEKYSNYFTTLTDLQKGDDCFVTSMQNKHKVLMTLK